MTAPIRLSYSMMNNDPITLMPRIALTLHNNGQSINILGLLDSGASVNVLPYHIGLTLGAIWEEQTLQIPLAGNLGRTEARVLIVEATHPQLTGEAPVELAFAWTRSENAPVLFGQMNFFHIFNVCFFRAENAFEVQLR